MARPIGSGETREALQARMAAAALDLLENEGLAAVSVRRLAGLTGCSPALVYHYFAGKDELVAGAVQLGYSRLLDHLQASLPPAGAGSDVLAGISCLFRTYNSWMLAHPRLALLVFGSSSPAILDLVGVLQPGIATRRGTFALGVARLQAAMDQGQLRPQDPELLMQIVWAANHGLLIRLLVETDIGPDQRERLLAAMDRLLADALRA